MRAAVCSGTVRRKVRFLPIGGTVPYPAAAAAAAHWLGSTGPSLPHFPFSFGPGPVVFMERLRMPRFLVSRSGPPGPRDQEVNPWHGIHQVLQDTLTKQRKKPREEEEEEGRETALLPPSDAAG